ncbi:putative transcription factor WD40-like family [Helianthus annuus]|uniref:Putative transducin family protein / WD-40 repeat family protein n=1 Tax=Helianthus annuus TaxID=4232 RepID=A0A251UZN4_HELAN|nr:transducin beta-like protein 3 [Helianthus annuus]KAF5810790.1 putative transcription factor WD40-like family [Helianthus annuus]KAJ0581547.1 putative transcription factor WD40-like family [Helianthus annuus]KAJ0589536.1 putative transcription factor WD40-like family [Helianthus annuus]KAJ0597510.1 putative transcription factor WD40-like family [Helianthus annuus]KAJ0758159.1 putative transcription factor WD40-like family [Helianthus annuus]
MASVTLKKNYRCVQSLQQFYSGGPYAVSSDGSFIACACNDTITIVDSSNASIKSTIEGDSESVTAIALSHDDKFLFSASHSRQISMWDLSSLKCLHSWKGGHQGPIMAMTCHAYGESELLATAGADGKVNVWDVEGHFCTHSFKGHKGVVTSVIFHPDPTRWLLYSGSDDTTVRVWDLISKKCVATLERHRSSVTTVAITEDGGTLLSGGRDQVVNMWNLHDYSCTKSIPTNEAIEAVCVIGTTTSFALCLQSKKTGDKSAVQFLTVGEHGIVRIWNSHGAVCLFQQASSDVTVSKDDEEEAKRGFTSAVMLPSGQGLLCVTADQEFLFYSPIESQEGRFQLNLNKRLVGYNEEIVDMKFVGVEEQFLAVATSVEQVRVYDLGSMSCSYVLAGHTDIVLCLDTCTTSSGRTLIVTGSKDNTVRLWDSDSRCCIGVGKGHMGGIGAVSFAKKLHNFFVSGSSDLTLKLWSLDDLSDDVNDAFTLKTKAATAAHDKDINALAVAPNDSLICSGSQDRTARIWKLPDLTPGVVLRGHKRGIWSVEFSPVDQCVITASGDKTIKIWAISDGSCLKTFEGHTSSVFKVQFLTRGAQFVSCGADGLLKLWTVKTNECVATYDQHEDKVWALSVGKKTEMLATGGSDAVINLWHDSTAADKEDAFRKEEESVLKGQELENAVLDANYTKAIHLAFELRRPHKLFELFGALCRSEDAKNQVKSALGVLSTDEYRLLLEYVREWNTKPKLCHVAQFVLFQVFSILSPTEIVEMKGVGELLEGLIPYSQRHYSRIDRLERSTFLLDYTLNGMSIVEPETETEPETGVVDDPKDESLMEVVGQGQEPAGEEDGLKKRSSKKRKSHKLNGGNKKIKG